MLPITYEEDAGEGSRDELIGTSAILVISGREEASCSPCCCLYLCSYTLNSLSSVCWSS
jgi:hypothetical protein